MKLTQQDILEAGLSDISALPSIYQHALELMETKSIQSPKYLIKHLKRIYPDHFGSLTMRQIPSPLFTAIHAETKEEINNLTKAETQITELLKSPVIEAGALMPDACPAGNAPASIPVGGVILTRDALIPAAHSADICCSLYASFFVSEKSTTELMDALQTSTRFGPGGRTEPIHHPVINEKVWSNPFLKNLQHKAIMHMADQGDGNHFASLGEMQVSALLIKSLLENGYTELAENLTSHSSVKVIVTHHGSRGLGAAVYQRGLDAAVKHTRKFAKDIPPEAAWLNASNAEGKAYWEALQYISRWTLANHQSIHQRFLEAIDTEPINQIGNEHNFIWKHDGYYLHGKGATPAWNDISGNPLLGLIPLNMAEPILLTLGKANKSYLECSPHGAGRNLSRFALFKSFRKKNTPSNAIQTAIANSTRNIDVRWYLGEPDLTECPVAYKSSTSIREQIAHYDLAEVIAEIAPLGCIMAGRAPKKEKPLTPKQLRQIEHRKNRRKARQQNWHIDNM